MDNVFIIQLLQFIAGIAILIVIHELGHFLAARLLKVEVEEFGLGFPPRLATLFEASGTKFTLNAIPLGGFVRPKGENDPDVPGGDGKLYALSYLTGAAVLDFNNDSNLERMLNIGRGIPSKPVTLITRTGTKLLISVFCENPSNTSPSLGAGVKNIDPLLPSINLFVRFWREVF